MAGKVAVLVYTVDLCFMAETPEKHSTRHNSLLPGQVCSLRHPSAQLLSTENQQNWAVESTKLHIDGKELPAMVYEDHYHYLGCQLGVNPRTEITASGGLYRAVKRQDNFCKPAHRPAVVECHTTIC